MRTFGSIGVAGLMWQIPFPVHLNIITSCVCWFRMSTNNKRANWTRCNLRTAVLIAVLRALLCEMHSDLVPRCNMVRDRNRSHEDTEAPAHAGDASRGDRTLGSSSHTVDKGRRAGARDSVEGGCGNPERSESSADECEL